MRCDGSEMTFLYMVIFLLLIVPDMFWKSTKHNPIEIRSIGDIFLFFQHLVTNAAPHLEIYFLLDQRCTDIYSI